MMFKQTTQSNKKSGKKRLLFLLTFLFLIIYTIYCHQTNHLIIKKIHSQISTFIFAAKYQTAIIVKLSLGLILAQPIAGILADFLSPVKLAFLSILILCYSILIYQIYLSQIDLVVCIAICFPLSLTFIGALRLACRLLSLNQYALYVALIYSLSLCITTLSFSKGMVVIPNLYWNYFEFFLSAIGFISLPYWLMYASLPIVRVSRSQLWLQWGKVFTEQRIWMAGVFAGLMYVPLASFADFWGKFYLLSTYPIHTKTASMIANIIIIGACLGAPLQVYCMHKMRDITLTMFYNATLSLVLLLIILYSPNMSFVLMAIVFLITGFTLSSYILSFILIAKHHSASSSLGLRLAMNNCMKIIASVIILELISHSLIAHWGGLVEHHRVIYSHFNYEFSLSLIPICLALAVIIAHLLHVTKASANFNLTMYDKHD